ncbi:AraC family transcriptional regulator [Fulvivirgaceae bacterium BMA10]|uniref:AraC family transcriptional regulator n=1 Tax=Splendidivirga corallicola TaxID=3051826 RepID=A0ABT8KNU8_9BACT|nr:AraC family transcriptional regulator [Fulvivirgaceae bacterium BMA10]
MIVDAYKMFTRHPRFNKVIGNDYVFLEFNCPLDVENFQFYTESNLITYVISGRKDWIAPDKKCELKAGDAIFVKKGIYSTKQYFEVDYCVLLFFLNDVFIRNFIQENPLPAKPETANHEFESIYKIHTDESFEALAQSIFHYLNKTHEIPQQLVELKFKELLYNIVLNPRNQSLLDLFNAIYLSTKSDIEATMMQNFRFDLPLEGFAKLCGRSLSSFKRDFKNQFGTTPSKWLITKRLEFAKTMLMGTELNVNEVCYESGFKNNSHFIKSFKSQFNITPSQFRATQS